MPTSTGCGGRIGRDQQILLENLALFVRYQLTVTAPLLESEQEAARAVGQERFESFVNQVGRHRPACGRAWSEAAEARDLKPALLLVPIPPRWRPRMITDDTRQNCYHYHSRQTLLSWFMDGCGLAAGWVAAAWCGEVRDVRL